MIQIIYNRWKGFHKLSQEEIDKYNGEGIEFRIVRTGTVIYLFLDGKQVAVCDLTNNNSGVTASTKATVSLRHYDAVAEQVDIPFTIAKEVSKVTITDNSQNGEVITENDSYVIGTEVILKGKTDGYYLIALKVDGETVTLNGDGTYKFVATKATYTVEGIFKEAVFVDNPNWNLKEQNQGTEDVNYVDAITGVVTLPNGGNAFSSSNFGGLKFKDQYTDIDLSLIVRDYDDYAYTYGRTDVLFEFDGGETVTFGVTKTGNSGDEANWTYRVQSMSCTLNNWKTVKDMSKEEIALYTGDSGIKLRILRSGTTFYIYLNDELAKSYDFNGKISADTKATVTLRHYADEGVQVGIPFTVADEVGNIFTTQGSWGGSWNISNQFAGKVSVNQTGTNSGILFANKYTDMDLSLKVKEHASEGATPGRTDVMLEFENGKNISFGVLCTDKANGKYFVQTLNKANDTSNAGKIIFNRGIGFYQLTEEEATKYNGDGLDFRIIRLDTTVYLFIDGKQVAECDLTANSSGVTADMKATVTLRHYDVKGTIEFPFAISNTVKEATVAIEPSTKGTITKNQVYRNGNRNTLYDITKHFVGEKVLLTMKPNKGYDLTGLIVNNISVAEEVKTNVDGTSTYAFEAKTDNNVIETYFDVHRIFVDNYDSNLWDITDQYDGIVRLPNGGGASDKPLQFYGQFTDIDLTINARDYADIDTSARTDIEFAFDVDGDGIINTSNGDQNVTFGVVNSGGYRVQTRGGTLLSWKTPHDLTAEEIAQFVISEEEIESGDIDGVDLRLVRSGTTVYIFVEGKQVAFCDLTKCANANGDTASNVTADTKMFVYLRHYDDARTGGVEIPFELNEVVNPIDVTINSNDKGSITTNKVNYYVNNGRTSKYSDTHFMGETIVLTATPIKGTEFGQLIVDNVDVTEQAVVNPDGSATYIFVTTKDNHEVTATFEQIKIFVDNYDSNLWDITDQYDGIVRLPNGGGASDKPLQFYGQFTDIDLTINARDYADIDTSARTDIEFAFDVDGDGIINTSNGDQNVTFGVVNSGGYRVQTRGGTLLSWKTPHDLTAEEIAQFVISEEEIESGDIDGVDLRLVRSGTTVYIFVEGKQVAFCDLTKCANANGDTASNVTADTKMFVYLRHYDDARTGGVEIPFELNEVVNPIDVTINSNDKGSITTNKVNYYVNNGRTSKYSDTHFDNEVILLTMTPINDEYECSKVSVNGTDVTENITVNPNGTATYAMKTAEAVYTVEVEFTRIPIFKTNYNASLWDVSKQFEGIVSLPNGGGATASPLQFNKTYEDVKATLIVRDYPYAGTDEADARTELGFEFENGETVQFGVVKTTGLYRIQTRGGSLLNWKTPYYIQNQSIIDSYVVTQEELSQGNPGGLEFSVVRKGTEFYLYLGDEMVKGYDFSYKISSDTKVNVFIRHYDDQGGVVEIPFTITEDFTIEEEDIRLFAEKEEVTDYAYSFAVIPDPQIVTENDVTKGETNLSKMFDWIIANKDSKKIQYVFNLGDITQNNNDAEWTLAAEQHARLTAAGIAYSAVRGNHDLCWYGKTQGADDYYDDEYTAYMGTDEYRAQFGGFYSEDNISNSWRTFEVGSVKYLMITMDYGPSDEVLNWASDIIYQHPDRNVIITTHAYLYRDGTTLDAEDNTPPSTTGGKNDGDDIWEKLVSKHENIVLVMSGHDPSENIVVNKSTGDNGNVVTSMLIDAQDAEKDEGSMAMVALLHFSEDGKNIQIEYYSTAKEKYLKSQNQFEAALDVVEEGEVVYGTGYVPVSGQQVKTETAYAGFPRTIEVTFNRSSNTTRQILLGNCGGTSNDYFNLEAPINENIIYLNLCLGGTSFQHSFNTVSVPTNDIWRVTVVIEDAAIKCYVNGELAQTRTVTNSGNGSKTMSALWEKVPSANLSNLYAVGSDLRAGYYFNGTIYDVALWSDVRTAEEIAGATISELNTDDYQDNLLAAYNFRAVYNANAVNPFHADLSDNGYDLTGTLNIGTSTIAPVGAYTTISVDEGSSYSTTINDEQRVTLSDTPYTLSTWIHVPTSVSDAAGAILGNYSGSYANALNFEISTNGNPRLYHRNESNAYDSLVFTEVDVRSDIEWVHLAFTISGNKVSCYVNGELKQTLVATNTIQLESTNKEYVIGGDLRNGNARAFKGRILALDLYDAILPEDKIKRLYMEGRETISEGKLSY